MPTALFNLLKKRTFFFLLSVSSKKTTLLVVCPRRQLPCFQSISSDITQNLSAHISLTNGHMHLQGLGERQSYQMPGRRSKQVWWTVVVDTIAFFLGQKISAHSLYYLQNIARQTINSQTESITFSHLEKQNL